MDERELLFTDVLNCNRHHLYLNRDVLLNKDKTSFISGVLKRRIRGEPIQYILGKTEFMGLEFKVTADVFIPRPETEILVEKVIDIVREFKCLNVRKLNILDIGTGSGCIAISLAKLLPNVEIIATDISPSALKIAQYNALLNNVVHKITFINSDLFTSYQLCPACLKQCGVTGYDIIVSNPPYIATEDLEKLQPEIQYEPRLALDGGKDGSDFYRRIINEAYNYLKNRGFLIIEIGFKQKEAIKNIFRKSAVFEIIEAIKDYHNIDRVIVARKKS